VAKKMPYKDQTVRRLKAKEYTAAYRAKQKAAKNLLPKATRTCLVCSVDISDRRQGAKFCSRAHKSVFSAQKRDYKAEYQANKEQRRTQALSYYHADPDKSRARMRESQKRNSHVYAANAAKYRSIKLQRTPVWLTADDLWMVKQAYELASCRSKMFGFKWHVDHIVPLQGSLVSGLHVPWNLQVIPAQENISKNNKFEVM
jgi:5-methylcytosine-specific restriction endonuclease McrA